MRHPNTAARLAPPVLDTVLAAVKKTVLAVAELIVTVVSAIPPAGQPPVPLIISLPVIHWLVAAAYADSVLVTLRSGVMDVPYSAALKPSEPSFILVVVPRERASVMVAWKMLLVVQLMSVSLRLQPLRIQATQPKRRS